MRVSTTIPIFILATASLASAQVDPPGRVGRLDYVTGAVSFQPAGSNPDDWFAAQLNRPLTNGDRIWVERDGRAEMQTGNAAVRLNSRTLFEFINLNDDNVQIRLSEGSLEIRLRGLNENESFEIDTPNLAYNLLRPGIYRIDANPDNQTTFVTVRNGLAEVTGAGPAFTVRQRQQARVTGEQATAYDLSEAPPPDWFDDWCAGRDRAAERSESARYVPRDMIGYQDLDDNGYWQPTPEYGAVWYPRAVPAGWAPYRHGHWAHIEPWGWTWIDDASWGFAPFHYGRWALIGGTWGWVPGPVSARPVYAPALVAWVGGGGIGAGAGVGWFPLGPREPFIPSYRHGPAYVNRVNNTTVINNINVTNIEYVNRTSVTAVSRETFVNARPVAASAVAVPRGARVEVVRGVQAAPVRTGWAGNAQPAVNARPPAAAMSRPVITRSGAAPGANPAYQERRQTERFSGQPQPAAVREPAQPSRVERAEPVQQAAPAYPERRPIQQAAPVYEERRQVRQAAPAYQERRPVEAARPVERAAPTPEVRRAEPVQRPAAVERQEAPKAEHPKPEHKERKERDKERKP